MGLAEVYDCKRILISLTLLVFEYWIFSSVEMADEQDIEPHDKPLLPVEQHNSRTMLFSF